MTATSERDGRKMHYDEERLSWRWDDTDEIVPGMLICPDCGSVLVKTHYQDADEGHWFVCWTCECEPDEAVIHACD